MNSVENRINKLEQQGLCVRCGGGEWIGMGCRIKFVDSTPSDAPRALSENLRKARLFLERPICEECESRIKRKLGGGISGGPKLIYFEFEREALEVRGPLALA